MSLGRGIDLLGWLPGSRDYARLLRAWKSVPLSLSVQRRRRLHRPALDYWRQGAAPPTSVHDCAGVVRLIDQAHGRAG
jgi:hypothetical protein